LAAAGSRDRCDQYRAFDERRLERLLRIRDGFWALPSVELLDDRLSVTEYVRSREHSDRSDPSRPGLRWLRDGGVVRPVLDLIQPSSADIAAAHY
jgi:hypothetical protein